MRALGQVYPSGTQDINVVIETMGRSQNIVSFLPGQHFGYHMHICDAPKCYYISWQDSPSRYPE